MLLYCYSAQLYLEALNQVQSTYFVNTADGYEPSCGLLSVTDGTLESIGHLFAASVVNGGQGPNFLSSWVYNFIVGNAEFLLPTDLTGIYSSLYKQVLITISLVRFDYV